VELSWEGGVKSDKLKKCCNRKGATRYSPERLIPRVELAIAAISETSLTERVTKKYAINRERLKKAKPKKGHYYLGHRIHTTNKEGERKLGGPVHIRHLKKRWGKLEAIPNNYRLWGQRKTNTAPGRLEHKP